VGNTRRSSQPTRTKPDIARLSSFTINYR
jgi:hypothetical protein